MQRPFQISTGAPAEDAVAGAAAQTGLAQSTGPLGRLGEVGPRAYTAMCREGRESQSVFSSQYPGSSF
jgi:hypothetical protein